MSIVVTCNRIPNIRELLGPAVLLPWPSGSKGSRQKWKHLQSIDMDDSGHLSKLTKAGNIGVALGKVSNGLVTIDLDQDSYVETFLVTNPPLANTLRTRGSRGCNIWVRCSDGYPSSQKLKNSSGDEIGEWRGDGNQTFIAGTHPEGMPYWFVVANPVITISDNAIIWLLESCEAALESTNTFVPRRNKSSIGTGIQTRTQLRKNPNNHEEL